MNEARATCTDGCVLCVCQPPVQLQMNDDSRENEQQQRSTRLLLLQQRVVGPALGDNKTLAQDDYDVAHLNSGEAMGDNDGGALPACEATIASILS
jgi:hypothetical protein